MNSWLVTHIATGSIALLSGLALILLPKGTLLHRYGGRFFALSMLISAGTAFVLAFNRNWFLFAVGLFSSYLTLTGWLYLRKFRSNGLAGLNVFMLVLIGCMGLGALYFLYIATLALKSGSSFGLVFIFFAGLSLLFLWTDFRVLRKEKSGDVNFLALHLQRMAGAFISALTAFTVVNYTYLPPYIPGWIWWILPTVILLPWIRNQSARVQNSEK
jgi:uncharacterized membrane protein